LIDFRPRAAEDQGADFGERAIRLQWSAEARGAPQERRITWDHPIVDQQKPQALIASLKLIVQRRLPEAELFYF
jgi:hypothetical protein